MSQRLEKGKMCIRDSSETLQRQLKEDGEKKREELRYILIGYREEVKQTKTGMNKKWEEACLLYTSRCV